MLVTTALPQIPLPIWSWLCVSRAMSLFCLPAMANIWSARAGRKKYLADAHKKYLAEVKEVVAAKTETVNCANSANRVKATRYMSRAETVPKDVWHKAG